MMKFFATLLIFTCALCLSVDAGVVGALGGGDSGDDDTLKSIATTILTKDGVLGDIFGGGRERRRRGRLLEQLGGGEDGSPLGGLFGGEGVFSGVVVGLAQDIIGAIKTAKLELVGNLLGNIGGGSGLGLGGLGSGARSDGPLAALGGLGLGGLLGGAGGGGGLGGLGEIKSTISDLKRGLFQKESGAFSGLLGDSGNPIAEAKNLIGEGLGDFGGLLGSDGGDRSGRQIHNFRTSPNGGGGLMQHSMCNFFCMTSRHRSVQENCLKRNRCLRGDDAVITEIDARKR